MGLYTIEVSLGDSVVAQIFKVEDDRKPDYEVTLTAEADQYISGDQIRVTLEARYFFGEPVVDAEIGLRLFDMGANWELEARQVGRTDEAGRLRFTVEAPIPEWSWDWRSSLTLMQLGIRG